MIFVMVKRDIYFFIDAGYLSAISKFLGKGKPLKYHIGKFAERLAIKQQLNLRKTFYYTAPPYQNNIPTDGELKRKARYDKFIGELRKIPNFIVREGRCQKCGDSFQQKGVDTLLTMDLLKIDKSKIDTIIILICDTDFVPVLEDLRQSGIGVILYYFSDFDRNSKFFMSNHLWKVCDKKFLLKKEDFENLPIENGN